jgi:two-component system phosphate regulon sensor histidine kinase PhoR
MLGEQHPDDLVGIGPEEFTRRFNLMSSDGHLIDPDDLISQRALKGDEQRPYKVVIAPSGHPTVVAMVTAAPVRPLADGPIELAVSVMHDITAFDQLHNAREEFVASAAHALRTPVAIIKAHLHLLAMSGIELPPTTVQVIERQCGKIVRLTENLIVLARISTDSLRLHPQPVSCAELVEEVARDMKEASADHGLINQVDGEPMVFADRDRLGLAVRNLIELAYRRSRPRTNVTIMVSKIEAKARICVTYEPFVDGEQLGRGDGAGFSGLGLEQHVIESLASASRGTLGSEDRDRTQHKDWLEFPTMVELSHV